MWVQTISGRKVDLLNPRPADIDLNDIASALSRIARLNGHTHWPYSVAQHCTLGAVWARRSGFQAAGQLALRFLLHDAHEAYIGDIARPVAQALCDSTRLMLARQRLDAAIWASLTHGAPFYGRDLVEDAVKEIDLRMLRAERDQLCAAPPASWGAAIEAVQALPVVIHQLSAEEAREQWLHQFDFLTSPAKHREGADL